MLPGGALKQPTLEETNLALLKTKQLLAQESLQRSLQMAGAIGGTNMPIGLSYQPLPVISLPQIAVAPTGPATGNPLSLAPAAMPVGERLDCRIYVG
jgi:hypothetical protein